MTLVTKEHGNAREVPKSKLSQFVISILVQFYDTKLKDDLRKLGSLRLVCRDFDEAVVIGLRINYREIARNQERIKDLIQIKFSES